MSRKSLEILLWVVTWLHTLLLTFRHELRYRMGLRHIYKARPDDVFLVTYPKSGTTLMQMMLYQLTTSGDMDFSHIYSVSPWFEMELRRGKAKTLEQLPSPRFFKTHLVYGKLPRNARCIYVARDVRDVAVSAYHHFLLVSGQKKEIRDFLDDFLRDHDKFFLGSWFKHTESWWPHRKDPNVLFLRYEDVIADLSGTVRNVARFCGIPLDEAELPRIVERCGIQFMKQHEQKFDPRMHEASQDSGAFLRKGCSGEGQLTFSPSQNRVLASRLEKLARKLGAPEPDAHWLLKTGINLDSISDA
jgi:hypothetical protein